MRWHSLSQGIAIFVTHLHCLPDYHTQVCDADVFRLKPELFARLENHGQCILTPNIHEFGLIEALIQKRQLAAKQAATDDDKIELDSEQDKARAYYEIGNESISDTDVER